MDNANPTTPQAATPSGGPGPQLQRARQDLHLAPEDVAQILHLSVKHIVALEQGDYKKLPGPTYVRGYLRSYAQLLGLAPEKIIESYNALIAPPKQAQAPAPAASAPAPMPPLAVSDRFAKIATLAVAAIVLSLVFLWWRGEGEAPQATHTSSAVANKTPVDSSNSTENLPAPHGNNTANSAAPTPEPTPSLNTAASSKQNTNQEVTVSGMILNVSPTEPAKVTGPAATTNTDRAILRTRRTGDVPPGVARQRLVLQAKQETWADVRDGHDNKLLYENIPAGRSIAIEGAGPFSVFLGNADGVQVEFNGKNYDVSQHKRGQVARFTLGEAAPENN